jgi:hypothetical protein
VGNERKEDNPFEPPQTDSKPQDEQAKLRGDRLGLVTYRISLYLNFQFIILLLFFTVIYPQAGGSGTITWWFYGTAEVIIILVAIASFFLPASSRKEAVKAILLSGFLIALLSWLIICFWS